VFDLEKAKTAQAKKIADLKKRVKKIERKKKSRSSGLKILYKEKMNEEDLFGVNDLNGDEVIMHVTTDENVEQDATVAEKEVTTADPVITAGEVVTTAEDVKVTTTAATPQISKDDKPLKKEDQIALDKEVVRKLEAQIKAKMEKEERIAREKNEANIVVIEERDDVQATIDADRQLAEQLQAQERQQLSIEERSKLLVELIKSRRKVNTFVDMNIKIVEEKLNKTQAEVTEGSSKRATDEIDQESSKRQRLKIEDDTVELKRCLEIVLEDDDDVTIEATPLSSKSPTIVDYKIYREGKKSYFKIIKADGNSQNYLTFEKMFKNFNREDLEVLRRQS
nr:hypothetical protein [Tanacetum cinerariifolium]